MDEAIALNVQIASIIITIVGWAGFLILVYMLREFVILGSSRAFSEVIQNAGKESQRWLIRCLVDKHVTLTELYKDMKLEEEAKKASKSNKNKEAA